MKKKIILTSAIYAFVRLSGQPWMMMIFAIAPSLGSMTTAATTTAATEQTSVSIHAPVENKDGSTSTTVKDGSNKPIFITTKREEKENENDRKFFEKYVIYERYLRENRKAVLPPPPFSSPSRLLQSGDENKPTKGKEYGESCKENADCFTGYCDTENTRKCGCLTESDCYGCSVPGLVCLRVEKSGPFGNLTICDLGATHADKLSRQYKMVSAGGAYIEDLSDLRHLFTGQTKRCTDFTPYLADAMMPPAFAQANVDTTTGTDDVGEIEINSEDLNSLIDTQLFLNEHWVKTIDVQDRETKGSRKIEVLNWPRVSVPSLTEFSTMALEQRKMYVVEIFGNDPDTNTWDFDWIWPELPSTKRDDGASGVEFIGADDSATIFIEGELLLQGRVSFKNIIVDFDLGTLNVDPAASLIFQYSNLIGLDRCPERYTEINGVCYYNHPIGEYAENAAGVCLDADPDGFLPTFASFQNDSVALSDLLLLGEEEVWIAPYTAAGVVSEQACTRLNSFGSEVAYSGSDCDSYRSVLCAATVKDSIIGRNYTSYFSDQLWPDWFQASARLIDPDRLPIQTGATLTIIQQDFRDTPGDDVELFTVTDALPVAVKVDVHVVDGDESVISVALDTLSGASQAGDSNVHEWAFTEFDSLPSRLQVHATGYACVSQVDLLLRNQTGTDHVAVSLPANIFASCYDYNVCNSTTETLCGRSLMYYNNDLECAVLDVGQSLIPRDLAFNLYEFSCGRLTTWHAEDLGEDMTVEINATVPTEGLIHFNQTNSDDHRYLFDPSDASKVSFPIQETPNIPTDFTVTEGNGSVIKSVRIQRYGLTILEADFSVLWDCINLCDAIASPEGVTMSEIDKLYISLLETVECNKLPTVFVSERGEFGEIQTGRDICTSPTMNATNVDDLIGYLAEILPSSYPYRTARVNVIEDTFDLSDGDNTVTISRSRGLELFVDYDVLGDDDAIFTDVTFVVEPLGELFMEDFVLTGSTNVFVQRDGDAAGVLELSGCRIDSSADPFLLNQGSSSMNTCTVKGRTAIDNSHDGSLELLYSDFQDTSTLFNTLTGTIRFSRMTLYETFPYPTTNLVGTIELPDTERFYDRVDEETDPLCFGVSIPSTLLEIPNSECQASCEDQFICSGYINLFRQDDSQVQCGLCLSEDLCQFDCQSNPSTSYLTAVSNFYYFSLDLCPIKSREYPVTLTGVSLEECKLYCEYYDTCEGFRVIEMDASARACILYADLDFEASCTSDDGTTLPSETIYIQYVNNDSPGFQPVQGVLSNDANELSSVPLLPFDKCSELCTKILDCAAFVVDVEQSCTLYDNNYFQFSDEAQSSNTTGLFVSVSSIFPKNRYTKLNSCPLDDSYASFNTKTLSRCKERCDLDHSCIAYIFYPFMNLFTDNCDLFNRVSIIDSIFPAESSCNMETETVDIYLAYTAESFVSSREYDTNIDEPASSLRMAFVSQRSLTGFLLDECKSVCLQERDCIAIRHDAVSFTCEIGTTLLTPSLEFPDLFYLLEARPADIGSRYLTIPGVCDYSAEEILHNTVLTQERSQGYTRFPRVCTPNTSGTTIAGITPSDCGLVCDGIDSCRGFVYYPDYGSAVNDGVVGTCNLISETVTFESCGSSVLGDVYLRGDIGNTCQALCNVHQLCSFYIFDDNVGCMLFSDMAILEGCDEGSGDTGVVIHVGLKYRERDALVKASNQCLIEYEDVLSLGCYFGSDYTKEDLEMQIVGDGTNAETPFACQQTCRDEGLAYYAVGNSNRCYCTDVNLLDFLAKDSTCTLSCAGDPNQFCGGELSVMVGLSNLPQDDLTLSQCKRACFEDSNCLAILYDDSVSPTMCELRTSAAFETCSADSSTTAIPYIESLEHYYETPTLSYRGDEILYTTTATTVACGRICDAFDECEAIRVQPEAQINNCEILGGNIVLASDADSNDILVAADVSLFTKAEIYEPDTGAQLAVFPNVFDLDECRALCDEHVECGSLYFAQQQCTLYRFTSFAQVPDVAPSPLSSYYVGYASYLVERQDFTESDGLCVAPATPLDSRVTTRSVYQCADRCRAKPGCSVFTYELSNQRNCILYDNNAELFTCSSSTTNSFVMYNIGRFTLREHGFLKDERILPFRSFSGKTLAECSALCDEYFLCRSFRSVELSQACKLFTSEQYFIDTSEPASPSGDLYTYFSDFLYVPLPNSFCVASTPLVTVLDTQLEACKKMCDLVDACLSFEHTIAGDCYLYSTSDFSLPCTSDLDRTLYISYQNLFDRPEFVYQSLSNCFDTTGIASQTSASVEECQQACSDDEICFGIQYDSSSTTCFLLVGGGLPALEDCTSTNEVSYLRTKSSPYQEMSRTCLRNPIEFDDRIFDTEDYECLALCDAHPFCRYYLYGTDQASLYPEVRECVLFSAQSIELDDCDNYPTEVPFSGYHQKSAFVNGRTFVDLSTYFGEPDETFAVIEGLSYQACASLCDSLEDDCFAFLHTWNYRRDSSASGEPLIFTRSRLIKADFYSGDARALYLEADTINRELILGDGIIDDDARQQAIVLNEQNADVIQFRIDTTLCVSGGNYAEIENEFILSVLDLNFDGSPVPTCQRLLLDNCLTGNAIEFVAKSRDGRITLSYELPNNGATRGSVGCLRSIPRTFDFSATSLVRDYTETGGSGSLQIPPLTTCVTPIVNLPNVSCTVTEERMLASTGDATAWVIVGGDCNTAAVDVTTCTNRTGDPLTLNVTTMEFVTTCREPPYLSTPGETTNILVETLIQEQTIITESGQTVTLAVNTTLTTQARTTTRLSRETEETCYITQKDGVILLEEMWAYYAGESACARAADGSEDFNLFSRAYGNGCGFDDDLVTIPSELFALASNPTLLSNNDFGGCLADDLSLKGCQGADAEEWVYIFNGGELFFTNDAGNMQCITRNAAGDDVTIQTCDSRDSVISSRQSWEYFTVNGTIAAPGTTSCLAYDDSLGFVTLMSCDSIGARFSQYSECRLNSYTNTPAMKLESIENPGMCINRDADNLVDCGLNAAGMYRYFYDTSESRLELVGTGSCFGKIPPNNAATELKDTATGLLDCSDLLDIEQKLFWLMTLGGENNNILQWQQVDARGDLINLYCYDVPQPVQEVCSADLSTDATWRQYGSAGDDTAISVRPDLLLQEITDPELLFQFFLYSPDGRKSRILRAKTAALQRDVELLLPFIGRTNEVINDGLNLLGTVSAPINALDGQLSRGASFFNTVSLILIPFERIPYVGPVLRALRLRTLSTQVRNACRNGGRGVSRLDTTIDATIFPIEIFGNAVEELNDNLGTAMQTLGGLVEYITRASFCALADGLDDEFDTLQEWINDLLSAVNSANAFIGRVERYLSTLDRLSGFMNNGVFGVFRRFGGILDGLDVIVSSLSFIEVLADFFIPIPWPSIRWFFFRIRWNDFKRITLEDIGNLLNRIESILKKIPGFGSVWSWLEDKVSGLIREIFNQVGIPLPNFGLDFSFLTDLKDDISNVFNDIFDGIDQLVDMINLGGLINTRFLRIADAITLKFPSDLVGEIDFDICDDENGICIPDGLGIGFNYDGSSIPSISFDGVKIGFPDELIDITDALFSKVEDFTSSFDILTDAGIECGAYKSLSVNPVEKALEVFNLNTTELGIPDCDFNFRVCTKIELPGIEAFQRRIRELFSDVLNNLGLGGGGGRRQRRKLISVEDVWSEADSLFCAADNPLGQSWGFSIPFPAPVRLLSIIFSKILPLRKLQRKYNWVSTATRYPESAFWFAYWSQQQGFFGKSFFNLLDFTPGMIFGCNPPDVEGDPGTFQFKFWMGTLFELSFSTLPLTKWTPTVHFSGVEVNPDTFNRQINDLLDLNYRDYKCQLEFIAATYNVIRAERYNGLVPTNDLNGFREIIVNDDIASEFFRLVEEDYSLKVYEEDYDEKKNVVRKKLLLKAIKLRSIFQTNYDRQPNREFTDSRYVWRAQGGVDSDCAGPARFPPLDGSSFKKAIISGGQTLFEFGKFFFDNTGYHPRSYGNLFGAGVNLGIVRDWVTGDQQLESGGFVLPLVGPFPGAYADVNEPGFGWNDFLENNFGPAEERDELSFTLALGNVNIFSSFLFLFQKAKEFLLYKQTIFPRGVPTSVATALLQMPSDRFDRPIAKKWGVRAQFSFGEWFINARQDEDPSVDEFTACAGATCIGLGFQGCNFYDDGPLDCTAFNAARNGQRRRLRVEQQQQKMNKTFNNDNFADKNDNTTVLEGRETKKKDNTAAAAAAASDIVSDAL